MAHYVKSLALVASVKYCLVSVSHTIGWVSLGPL